MLQFYKRQMKPVGTVKSADHTELAGRTMGIVGMGGIGSVLARRALWFRYAHCGAGRQTGPQTGFCGGAARP
jgi:phosphoglycerate dehydrogenase-like enzyme